MAVWVIMLDPRQIIKSPVTISINVERLKCIINCSTIRFGLRHYSRRKGDDGDHQKECYHTFTKRQLSGKKEVFRKQAHSHRQRGSNTTTILAGLLSGKTFAIWRFFSSFASSFPFFLLYFSSCGGGSSSAIIAGWFFGKVFFLGVLFVRS